MSKKKISSGEYLSNRMSKLELNLEANQPVKLAIIPQEPKKSKKVSVPDSGQISSVTTSDEIDQNSNEISLKAKKENKKTKQTNILEKEQDRVQTRRATTSKKSAQITSQPDEIMSNRKKRWEIDGINDKIIHMHEAESSHPFYTGDKGYAMRLWAHFNLETKYLALHFQLVQGDNDNDAALDWPFKYNATLSLINKAGDSVHQKIRKCYDAKGNIAKAYNKPDGTNNKLGFDKFIELDELLKVNTRDKGKSLVVKDKLTIECFISKPSNPRIK